MRRLLTTTALGTAALVGPVAFSSCAAAQVQATPRPSPSATTPDQTSASPARAFPAPQSQSAGATAPEPAPSASTNDEITVTGWRLRELDKATTSGSRLGLSVRELPATVDQIGAAEMLTRGFRTVEEATDSLPGVTSGGSPGDPVLLSMRGFTGEQITILHNGLYLGPANMINRPGNTFNLASIDILKGPGSVLYGQGAIGGAVNIVDKRADFDRDSLEALGSFATFDTLSVGVGGNHVLSDTVAARADVSYHRTDGYVDRSGSDSFNATVDLVARPSDKLSIELNVDYLEDSLPNYYGTPLVPRSFARDPIGGILETDNGYVIDRALRFKQYNVSDSRRHSWQVWPRLTVDWKPTDAITVSNTAYYFHAERQWINAETYSFDSKTNLIDRDRFFVFHNQDLAGDQLSGTWNHRIAGLDNRILLGIDYSHLDFIRTRGFPDGDSVDPYHPAPGTFGPIVPRVSPTRWDDGALFGEDVLSLTHALKLVTGLRAERLWLLRENFNVDGSFNAGSSFARLYKLFNWRAGLTYDIAPHVTVYGSYSTGKDPVGSNIFLVNANQNFGLSSSRQYEAGVKADLLNGRGSLTLAVYDIKRDNILTQIAIDTLSNVGEQKSRGVEFSGQVKVTRNWALIGSATYTDAEYADFVDPNYGVAASGNRPPNVPPWTGNLWTTFQHVAGLPLELGGGVKYVGQRDGNTANTLILRPYALGIVYATYKVNDDLSLTGRINNLWDKAFVQWADIYYPSQVQLGEPRRFEVSALVRF